MAMLPITQALLEELEHRIQVRDQTQHQGPGPAKINATMAILERFSPGKEGPLGLDWRPALAFSGGADSTVLLDLAARTGMRPVLIWADTGMEYPETEEHIRAVAKRYGFRLAIARPTWAPLDQWAKTGWPMLGKMAARKWNQANGAAGFKINTSECCRAMKIGPARKLTKNLGCLVQITGQRGKADDQVRGYRAIQDGAVHFQQRDQLWIVNPLQSWTDGEIIGYAKSRGLPEHPARKRGALTIGCVFCGGGSQFENSGYRVLRQSWPEAWWKFIVSWGGGRIVLALKYKVRLDEIDEVIGEMGGLEELAMARPWIFDYTRRTPLKGYERRREET